MITLTNITFSYDGKPIINNISLSVPAGAWLGLVGPNGAGKTTLIKLMSGRLSCNRSPISEITINGQGIKTYSRRELARFIAVIPQTEQFIFPFTALEIVLMGRYPHIRRFCLETGADMSAVKRAMEETDTWQFKDRRIDELSGGEKQRVLAARALAQEPKILLMDEPTAFLDIKHQIDILNIAARHNKDGLTVVSAIHDINLAILYCSEIALLDNGAVFKSGRPEDVITYANLKKVFGADVYVGTNELTGMPYYVPMNLGT